MLFWYFSIRWNSTLPAIGKVFFLSSKSTVPTIGKALFRSPEKELFNFRSVASSDCQYVRETVTTGFV